jgi:hypothetical protein
MRREFVYLSIASLLALSLSACAKHTEQASESTTDSLLSSSPVEQPAGDISPQTNYQTPEPTSSEPPTPAASKPASRPKATTRPASSPSSEPAASNRGTLVAAGTPIEISVSAAISSETANIGDTWTGEVKEPVIVDGEVVIPAGSTVEGVVTSVTPAQKGSRASLDLGVRSVTVGGKSHSVDAGTEAIVAGSTRARNLGAIAGGAAAGALIGKAVGGSGKGAVIGGLIGGATAGGAVAASKGFQVVVKEGTVITFNVSKDVRVRT